MNIGAFIEGLKGNSNREQTEAKKLIDKQIAEYESRSSKLKILSKTAGFKELEVFMRDRIELFRKYRDTLEAGSKDDIKAQALVGAYTDLLSFVDKLTQ